MRWFAPIVLLAVLAVTHPSVGVGEDAPVALSVSPGEVDADLAALSNPQYRVREEAARRLVSRKAYSVDPLTQVALVGNTEASVRAFDILRQLYRDGDEATCAAVESALETLASSDNVAVAARAESSINGVAQKWHRRAVETFIKLGGGIRYVAPAPAEDPEAADNEDKFDRPIQYALIKKTWTGGDDGLKYLRRIEDFRSPPDFRGSTLYVIKGAVSKNAIAALEGSLPNLHVAERGPAQLGISPSPRPVGIGLMVGQVSEGSAAQRAGIMTYDILLKFNGHNVNDFEGLVDKISEKEPGDKVPVVFMRGDMEQTVVVELRPWE